MVPRLVAGGLVLVPAVAGDLDWLLGLLILPDVRRYLCDDRVFTREEVAGMLAETLALPDGLGMWRIEIDPGARAVLHRAPPRVGDYGRGDARVRRRGRADRRLGPATLG